MYWKRTTAGPIETFQTAEKAVESLNEPIYRAMNQVISKQEAVELLDTGAPVFTFTEKVVNINAQVNNLETISENPISNRGFVALKPVNNPNSVVVAEVDDDGKIEVWNEHSDGRVSETLELGYDLDGLIDHFRSTLKIFKR